ncbi:MAG TPA: hypothetical protein DC023_05085 [Oceanospirillaceae bacterium]|nr:hypothetical protein [Oceanospirillaceae bacterium]
MPDNQYFVTDLLLLTLKLLNYAKHRTKKIVYWDILVVPKALVRDNMRHILWLIKPRYLPF